MTDGTPAIGPECAGAWTTSAPRQPTGVAAAKMEGNQAFPVIQACWSVGGPIRSMICLAYMLTSIVANLLPGAGVPTTSEDFGATALIAIGAWLANKAMDDKIRKRQREKLRQRAGLFCSATSL
jgi:hypothetical protein